MPLYFKRAVDAAGQGAAPGARQVSSCDNAVPLLHGMTALPQCCGNEDARCTRNVNIQSQHAAVAG